MWTNLFWSAFLIQTATQGAILPSFQTPPVSSRPKFRYWFPDASIPPAAVQSDIASLSEVSSGGLQFLGFYNQGFPPISTNWSLYGFGTPAFKELLRAALRTTAEHGLLFDFAIGPNTAAGVPAVPRTEGLAMELVYGATTVNASQSAIPLPLPVLEFNHQPLDGWVHEPENWGPSELVAVVAAKVKGHTRRTTGGRAAEQVVLDKDSVLDITNSTRNGMVDWKVPAGSGQWAVFAFYQRYSNERLCVSTPQARTWIGNGSWMVDHFSVAGAKKVTDFWDEQIFDDKEIDGLMRRVGGYSWEDSMEMMAPLWWTPNFTQSFQRNRGYSPVKHLAVFFQAKNLWNSYGEPYDTSYSYEAEPDGGKYAEDYRLTLSEGYQDYLRQHQQWAAARGMSHSTQPAYNMPLDMSATIPLVGAPELESLGFGESIDNYRQFSGPAHFSGRNVISTEIGAQRGGAYAQTVPTLLKLFLDSFAAGVNTLVIHGFAYGGPYAGTTWPGYTPFQYEFCEMWGPRQPAWQHLNDTLLFAARMSEMLKTGVPRVDLAFYAWKQPWSARGIYPGSDLTAAGYTYEYLGPDNLASAMAVVRDDVLCPDGPAYKAIVIYGQSKITALAAEALLGFARVGLPIFIVGSLSMSAIGVVGQDTVSGCISQLTSGSFSNVKILPSGSFGPDILSEAGVFPRLFAEALEGSSNTSQLFTTWRRQPEKQLDLVYLLNRGQDTTFRVSFSVGQDAVPYRLDAWTGEQIPLLKYLRTSDGVSLSIPLAKSQSWIIGFTTDEQGKSPLYIVSSSPNLVRADSNDQGKLVGYVDDLSEVTALLSSNREVIIPPLISGNTTSTEIPALTLGPWELSVEAYGAPSTLSYSSVAGTRTRINAPSPLAKLVPWTSIRGLEKVSGVGTYRASFRLAPLGNETSTGYTVHLTGRIINTVRIWVNGALVPALDLYASAEGRDITPLVNGTGQNEIVIEVASTLFNAVKARMNELRNVGSGVRVPRYYTQVQWAEFGMVGEVAIRQWRRVVLE